jgi:hypothetical protein
MDDVSGLFIWRTAGFYLGNENASGTVNLTSQGDRTTPLAPICKDI